MTSKFEQLIEYVINDEEAKAKELFHDIVVEKSREIYENLMSEEEELDEADEELDEAESTDQEDEKAEVSSRPGSAARAASRTRATTAIGVLCWLLSRDCGAMIVKS